MAFKRFERIKNPKGNLLEDYKAVTYYDYHEVDELVNKCNEVGYECIQTYEGSLGSGDWILVAPDDNYYNFVIKEVALNEWQSAHRIHRKKRLSKADLATYAKAKEEAS